MMQGKGNRGRGNGGAPQRRTQARVSNLNNQLRGTKFVPSPYPRPFTAVPWNSLTVEIEQEAGSGTSVLNVSVSDIRTKVQEISGSVAKIKVLRAEVWCTANGLSYPSLKTQFYDLEQMDDPTNAEPRSQQSDRGTLNMPAKAGFLWPMNDQKRVLASSENSYKVLDATAGTTGMVLLVRVHVLWHYTNATF